MQIKGLSDQLPTGRPDPLGGAKKTARTQAENAIASPASGARSSDRVDTSTLSRMMAQSRVDLNLELSVRPGRVEAARKIVELPADFPDKVVDEVMKRLP